MERKHLLSRSSEESLLSAEMDCESDKQLSHPNSDAIVNSSGEPTSDDRGLRLKRMRNNVGFWLLGLTNNYAYVVMLSAAFDILSKEKKEPKEGFHCNKVSTGAVLLADILPALIVKATAPFFMQRISYHVRVAFVVLTALSSFLIVALATSPSSKIFGVVCASISSGLGEISFLSYSSYFDKDVLSAWSSGTGAAGVFGAISYAALTSAGLSSRDTILLMLIVPVILAVSFWFVLKRDREVQLSQLLADDPTATDVVAKQSLETKLKLIKPLIQYMVPLFAVYVAEYVINQGLFELVYFKMSWLSQAEQYRWFQVTYQIGVFISRSSAVVIRFRNLELIAALQYVVFGVLMCQVAFRFLPSIWFALLIILVEGFFGGAVYVNSFYNITEEVSSSVLEYSLGVVSMADSAGITLAGLLALPLHNYLCDFAINRYGTH